jgi:hypothetical protein
MNRLHPDLKRLMRLANRAPSSSNEVPYGFSTRVVANWRAGAPCQEGTALQRIFATVSWASALVIVCCGLFLANQARVPKPATDFTIAAQFLAKNLVP